MQLDQASGLRRLFEKRVSPVVAFASSQRDSGRIGDRAKVMHLCAKDIAESGRSLVIVDEHSLPGSISRVYGVNSRRDFKHVLHGDHALDDVLLDAEPRVSILPAARAAGMEYSLADEVALAGNLAILKHKNDCVLLDSVQRAQCVLSPIARMADQLIMVVPAADDELTLAYGLIKRIIRDDDKLPISIVVVHAPDPLRAKSIFDKMHRVAMEHLGVALHYQGTALTPGSSKLSLTTPRQPDSLETGLASRRSGNAMRLRLKDSVV